MHSCRIAIALFASASPLLAAVVGFNPPSQPLTAERIAALPDNQQATWKDYLQRSQRHSMLDRKFLGVEIEAYGPSAILFPPQCHNAETLPMNNPAEWYATPEALRIADIVISFQTPSGGWSKNLDLTQHARLPGESFTPEYVPHLSIGPDYDLPRDWNYIGTLDNDATTTELRFLAKVATAAGDERSASYRAAFLRGLEYIFAAQYPNGGWPQVWPLQGGYHDAITYNDNAMIYAMMLLNDAAAGRGDFAFVPPDVRTRAAAAVNRGVDCILATQIVVNGQRTVWCQQNDPLTLQPCSARNFEMPAQCTAESATLVIFLMKLPDPSPAAVSAVHAAAAWFQKTAIPDHIFKRMDDDRKFLPQPGAGPIWARFYETGTDRPVFGDRDKSIHDAVSELSHERRNGYAWYGESPRRALELYESWRAAHPGEKAGK